MRARFGIMVARLWENSTLSSLNWVSSKRIVHIIILYKKIFEIKEKMLILAVDKRAQSNISSFK